MRREESMEDNTQGYPAVCFDCSFSAQRGVWYDEKPLLQYISDYRASCVTRIFASFGMIVYLIGRILYKHDSGKFIAPAALGGL